MLYYLLRTAVNIYSFLILVYVLCSWLPESHNAQWYRVLRRWVTPYLRIFHTFVPRIGFIDISPMIALLCLGMLPFIVLKIVRFIVLNIFQSPWLLQYI